MKATFGWPLNQNGAPAASLTPVAVPVGASSGAGSSPLAGKSTLWNPLAVNLILSPLRMVTPCGKKSLTSIGPLFWICLDAALVGPRLTDFVLA